MIPEATIFKRQRRARHAIRQILQRPEAIVEPADPVSFHWRFIADLRQESSVAIIHDGSRLWRYEAHLVAQR